jgi:hypothetical protein
MKNSSYEKLHEIFENCDKKDETNEQIKPNLKCILIKLPNPLVTEMSELRIEIVSNKIEEKSNSKIQSILKQRKSIPMKTLNVYDFSKSTNLQTERKTVIPSLHKKISIKKQFKNSRESSIVNNHLNRQTINFTKPLFSELNVTINKPVITNNYKLKLTSTNIKYRLPVLNLKY